MLRDGGGGKAARHQYRLPTGCGTTRWVAACWHHQICGLARSAVTYAGLKMAAVLMPTNTISS